MGCNNATQIIYGLKRMLEPCVEHVDNNFSPLPQDYVDEFIPVCNDVDHFLEVAQRMISTGNFEGVDELLVEGNAIKSRISQIRHAQQDRIQRENSNIKLHCYIFLPCRRRKNLCRPQGIFCVQANGSKHNNILN